VAELVAELVAEIVAEIVAEPVAKLTVVCHQGPSYEDLALLN